MDPDAATVRPHQTLDDDRVLVSGAQVALAWLLRRAPNILLIPGTSSMAHLRENLAAATLDLPDDALEALTGAVHPRAQFE